MRVVQPIWLASRSPRRRQMLMDAGVSIRVQPPDFDDASLHTGRVSPAAWVIALAYFKARRVADILRGTVGQCAAWWDHWASCRMTGTVLGADTVCSCNGELLGQPCDAADAARMLAMLRNRTHETLTGVCFIGLQDADRFFLYDRATVRIGALSNAQIDHYVASGDWQGKAGAYNLIERINARWPIECSGDPTTVMGLPMRKLNTILERGSSELIGDLSAGTTLARAVDPLSKL